MHISACRFACCGSYYSCLSSFASRRGHGPEQKDQSPFACHVSGVNLIVPRLNQIKFGLRGILRRQRYSSGVEQVVSEPWAENLLRIIAWLLVNRLICTT